MTKLLQVAPGPNGNGFGWRKDPPDDRDFRLSSRVKLSSADALPRVHSFRDKMPPVRNQHETSCCVGFSTSTAVSYLRRIDSDRFDTIHSPLFSYYTARLLEDPVNKTWVQIDGGANIRLAVKGINQTGISPESNWPFIPDKINKNPLKSAYKAAGRWKLGGYYKCNNSVDVMNAISHGYPVVGGITCYTSMFTREVEDIGDIPDKQPNDRIEGYHAICFCSYDQDKGRSGFVNSWGDWGDKGYGTIPLSWFDDRGKTDDLWALIGESEETQPHKKQP